MKKYGVPRAERICDMCGEPLHKIDGDLICLECELNAPLPKTKGVKIPTKKKRGADETSTR